MPIAPTLILGLGGTGSKIVEKVAQKVNESGGRQGDRIGFVVFDTDINDLARIRHESPDIYTVQTSTRNTVGEYLGINTNARDNWFPVNEMMNRKTLTEGAAQVRAISRLAFDTTLKAGNLAPLHQAIERLFRIDKDQEEQSLRVIITSSLAGGTGSGIILSVAMYLANYLKAKFPKAKAITRGFFIQPDVFYDVIPGAEEQQNLQVNAYAAVRELDAFLMKGDNTLPEQYKELVFEFPRVGADGVEAVDVMPYDFCFLFDAKNKDGGSLDSFASYLDHAATCIYTQSIGPMSKKSNSREDNVLREVIKNDGRNRYAGAGASRLVYPWQHLRDVIGLRWANEALSEQWLRFDRVFKEMQAAQLKQREAGLMTRDLDRGQSFVSAVDSAAKDKDAFAIAVRNQCVTFDEEGITETGKQWDTYVGALEKFIENRDVDPNVEDQDRSVSGDIQNLADTTQNSEYVRVFEDLERLKVLAERAADTQAGVLGYTLFKTDGSDVTQQRHEHRLESYLRDRVKGTFIHPVSARYFLYQTARLLEEKKREVEAEIEKFRNDFDSFESDYFDDPSTEATESADHYGSRKLTLREKLTRKPGKEKQDMADGFTEYRTWVQEYGNCLVYSTVLADAMEYVQGMSTAFERFFASLDGNLKRLATRVEQERTKYDDLSGSTTRYVLATSPCLDSIYTTMPYLGGVTSLDSDLSMAIYKRVREYYMLKDEKDENFFKDLYNHTILGYFQGQVQETYSDQLKIDIIEALEREEQILSHNFEEATVRHKVVAEIEKAKRLAAPFIEQPLGEERHPIVACAYNPALEGDSDPKRKSLISEILGNYGGEKDSEISPQEILFYNAIYGIRARDLSKFSPARSGATEHRAPGEYFSAYYHLVSGIKPSVGETKVITPHIDRRWHSISAMPDLDEGSQARQLFGVHRALLLGLSYNRIEWSRNARGTSRVYRFKPGTGLDEDFIVSNGTPCDQFYEVLDALTINPVAVEDITKAVERAILKERERMRIESFEQTRFGQLLQDGLPLEQLEADFPEFKGATFSVLDLAAFAAMSTPSDKYIEELLFSLSRDCLEVVTQDVATMTDDEDVAAKTEEVLTRQLEMFAKNIEQFVTENGTSFTRKLRTVLRPLINIADERDMIELTTKASKVDAHLRTLD